MLQLESLLSCAGGDWLSRYLAELTCPPALYQRGIIGAGITGRFTCQTDEHYQYGFNSYCLPTHPLVFIEPSLQVSCAEADWYSHIVEQYTQQMFLSDED
jgi:hypothetical protein